MILTTLLLAGGAYLSGKFLATEAKEEFRRQGRPGSRPVAPPRPALVKGPQTLTKEEAEEAREAKGDLNLILSGSSLAISAVGSVVYPPAVILSLPLTVIACMPIFSEAWRAWKEEGKLGVATVDALGTAGPLLTAHFTVAAMFATLIHGSAKLLRLTERSVHREMVDVFANQPKEVTVLREGQEIQLPFVDLMVGDRVVVRAGQLVPVDGMVEEGVGQVDQSALTGEAQPVDRGPGEPVFAATMLVAGRLVVRVERAGAESVAGQIVEILNHTEDLASAITSRGQILVERGANPTLLASGTALLIGGVTPAFAVLFSSLGYSMREAGPISALNFLRLASQQGILVKDGRALERLGQIDTFLFDKTGTLTEPMPEIRHIHRLGTEAEDQILVWAASAEQGQSHPIAHAILEQARRRNLVVLEPDRVTVAAGYGLQVHVEGQTVLVGNARLMFKAGIPFSDQLRHVEQEIHAVGGSLVYVAVEERIVGVIELHAVVRAGVQDMITALQASGHRVAILSGDHEVPTRHLAEKLGVNQYFAGVLPQEKAGIVRSLQDQERQVCFVGDGINDALALRQAEVSVSLAGASAVATDAASIVLMDGSLRRLLPLVRLGEEFDTNLDRGAMISLTPGIFCVAGVFVLNFGLHIAILISNAGLVAAVGNAMVPLLVRREPEKYNVNGS